MSDKIEHKNDLEMILNILKSDAIAITYQSIKHYRENIIKEIELCLNLLTERMADEQSENCLHKHNVSSQRELLIAFIEHLRKEYGDDLPMSGFYTVDRFLESN
jgi:hypothetical protein